MDRCIIRHDLIEQVNPITLDSIANEVRERLLWFSDTCQSKLRWYNCVIDKISFLLWQVVCRELYWQSRDSELSDTLVINDQIMIAFVCCNVCIMKSANTGIVLFICALQVDIQSVGWDMRSMLVNSESWFPASDDNGEHILLMIARKFLGYCFNVCLGEVFWPNRVSSADELSINVSNECYGFILDE